MLHQFRREGQVAQERAEALITLSDEQGFPFWLALGTILQGWALAEQGQGEEGIAQIRQGLAAWRATGAEAVLFRYFWRSLAEAYGKVGQVQEGLRVVAEALAQCSQNWGALVRGRAVSAERRADARTKSKVVKVLKLTVTEPPIPNPRHPSRGRSMFSESH